MSADRPTHLNSEELADYIDRAVDASEKARIETHLAICVECRSELLEARRLLLSGERRLKRPWLIAAAAAAAALVAIMFWPRGPGPEDLAPLGTVLEPPIYLGVPVRAEETRADSLFGAAMEDYRAEDYGAAAAGLRAALSEGVDTAPAAFFLASSYLMLERLGEAADAYAQVIELEDTPYLGEAHFYLAKALLRMGDGRAALRELEAAAATGGPTAEDAQALADSLEVLLRR